MERGLSLDTLLEMSDEEVRNLLLRYETDEEDMIRLTMALRNLKFWTGNSWRLSQAPSLNRKNCGYGSPHNGPA